MCIGTPFLTRALWANVLELSKKNNHEFLLEKLITVYMYICIILSIFVILIIFGILMKKPSRVLPNDPTGYTSATTTNELLLK